MFGNGDFDEDSPMSNPYAEDRTAYSTVSTYKRPHKNSILSIQSQNIPKPIECEYCHTKNRNLLVKCSDQGCFRWFCNSDKVKGGTGSHIFLHLKKANHKVIELHRNRNCKIGKIKCFKCKSNKVFALGMIISNKMISCRECFNETEANVGD